MQPGPGWLCNRINSQGVIDPHVELLSYDFVLQDTHHDFGSSEPWAGQLGDFDCRLEKGRLQATPQQHYVDVEPAREDLEPYLHAWELDSELEHGLRFRFRFSSAKVVDRDPTPGSASVAAQGVATLTLVGGGKVQIGHSRYPAPPVQPVARSPLVDELMGWIWEMRTGHRLLVIAYLVLTRLEFEYGGRGEAASALNVTRSVLETLGRLGVKNDPTERRKVKGPISPLSPAEKEWIRAVLLRLVHQAAEVAAGAQPPAVTMADLPSLS